MIGAFATELATLLVLDIFARITCGRGLRHGLVLEILIAELALDITATEFVREILGSEPVIDVCAAECVVGVFATELALKIPVRGSK